MTSFIRLVHCTQKISKATPAAEFKPKLLIFPTQPECDLIMGATAKARALAQLLCYC